MTSISHYSQADLATAFQTAGLSRGDVVLSYTNVGLLGIPAEGNDRGTADRVLLQAFQQVVGEEGTVCVPTYTYSFAKREPFDPDNTPSALKGWSEYVRTRPGACRTRDPIFSVAALGARARELTEAVPFDSFARDSFWDRFIQADGWVMNVNLWAIAGLAHYVERRCGVKYRYDKLFVGDFIEHGVTRRIGSIFTVQDQTNKETVLNLSLFEELAYRSSLARKFSVGRGFITAMRARDMERMIREMLADRPYFLIQAGLKDEPPVLMRKSQDFQVSLPVDATLREMVEGVWRLPRDIVSDGYDAALEALADVQPMTIHKYASGTRAWTWIVPEKWACHEAWLETMDGRRLIDHADHPLHVMSYSLPYEGVVTREQLLAHLYTHPILEDEIPFCFKYYDRDWALCCTSRLKETLVDDEYRVRIRSEFSLGELKVGEVILQGQSEDSFVFCSHLCHPAQVADDLSGVVVGLEVMRRLRQRAGLRYTYRLLILPETIGSVAWLSQNEDLIPSLKGGLFLEMLSLPNPHVLQLSYEGDSLVDRCLTEVFREDDPVGKIGAFRTVVGNDERQFNAPGARVPMLSLSRVQAELAQGLYCYPEYHSSADNPAAVVWENLEHSVDLVLRMVDRLEVAPPLKSPPQPGAPRPGVPRNLFKGEIFCTRYGIKIDCLKARAKLFDILNDIDGQKSVDEIATRCGTTADSVMTVIEELLRHGLVEMD